MIFDIGHPEQGWVTIRLTLNTETIEFTASRTPNNPIPELIDALHTAASGREACVWWHLEPDGWYFDFIPAPAGITLRILFAPASRKAEAEVRATLLGSKRDVLLPLWRGLRTFEAYGAVEPHWPPLTPGALAALGVYIKRQSAPPPEGSVHAPSPPTPHRRP